MSKHWAVPALLVVSCAALAEPAADPWAGVPALPTHCYQDEDTFTDQAFAAMDALDARKSRQQEINQAVQQPAGEMDIMAVQQRMITLMTEHPEKAQQYMEAIQQGGQLVQEQTPELSERSLQLQNELQELLSTYDTELRQALEPVHSRQQALGVTLSKTCNDNLVAQAAALKAEENRAYGDVCSKWWNAGPFHDWFTRFRQFKIEEAGHWASYTETSRINYELMGVPADDLRSTADLEAPIEYLRHAREVFRKREHAPVSEEPGDCEIRHG